MKLLPNWADVLKRAWSVRLIIIAGILSGVEVLLPLLDGVVYIPPGLFAGLSAIVTMAAFIARIVAQNDLPEG